MPVDAATAIQIIQQRGVAPPEGIQPGSAQYQQWATNWLQNAVNAGDPAAIRAAGGGDVQETGWEQPGGAVYDPSGQNAAAPDTWLGQRAPTPSELRRYARETGWSEDFARYSDRQIAKWIQEGWDVTANKFRNPGGALVEKPTEAAGGWSPAGVGGGGGGGFGGGGGQGLGALSAPTFTAPQFTPPSYEQALSDPGYQFALQQGEDAIKRNASALGTLRTGGTLQDLTRFNQGLASQQYGNVFNRALQTFGTKYQGAQDEFAPLYGSWQLGQNQDLTRWQTRYGGDLSKYLQRENTIANLLSAPPPYYGG